MWTHVKRDEGDADRGERGACTQNTVTGDEKKEEAAWYARQLCVRVRVFVRSHAAQGTGWGWGSD